MSNWKSLSEPFSQAIHDALLQQHHAVQFLTMLTRAFIPAKEDDSHTSLSFETALNTLVTRTLEGEQSLRFGLRLTDLSILIIDSEGHVESALELNNKSKAEAFDTLRKFVGKHHLPAEKMKEKLHYSIPDHPLDKGARFSIKDQPSFYENVVYRHNAKIALKRITTRYQNASETRVWPHHFDSAGLIPLAFDDKNKLYRSIGVGFAIPDSMVPEPYFYVSFWSGDPSEKIDNPLPFSDKGIWKTPDWQGAVLPLSALLEVSDSNDQNGEVNRFFDEGISRIISVKNKQLD